jgi:4-hydroxy-tetrahydrodipicolinate reductase
MINLVVGGATGRLGRLVCGLAAESEDVDLVGATVSASGGNVGKEMFGIRASAPEDLMKLLDNADVYVDLTTPSAASEIIADVPSTGTNVILGTTGIGKDVIQNLSDKVAEYGVSGIVSANFSRGVNVFWKMCGIMASALEGYDIEVIETHHRHKKDAPSGTAMEAVRRMQSVTGINDLEYGRHGVTGERGNEICIHSVRAGDVYGDHTVMFGGGMETLELKHRAVSREVFAVGCMDTVRWIAGRKDGKMHSMDEVFGL